MESQKELIEQMKKMLDKMKANEDSFNKALIALYDGKIVKTKDMLF